MFKKKEERDSFIYSIGTIFLCLGFLIISLSSIEFLYHFFIFDEDKDSFFYFFFYGVLGGVPWLCGDGLRKLVKNPEAFLKNKIDNKPQNRTEDKYASALSFDFIAMSLVSFFVAPDYLITVGDFSFILVIYAILSLVFYSRVSSYYKKLTGFVEEKK